MSDQPRPVWLDSETIVAINQALIDAEQRGVNERFLTWNLGAIVAAWDAAPADATEAPHLWPLIRAALSECAETNEIEIEEHHLDYLANWAESSVLEEHKAVLRALGMPK